jgi:ethanolamine ammonia-lyase large subunit
MIGPDSDEVSRLIVDTHDRQRFALLASMTIGEFREYLLDDATDEQTLHDLHAGIVKVVFPAHLRPGEGE